MNYEPEFAKRLFTRVLKLEKNNVALLMSQTHNYQHVIHVQEINMF